MDIFSTAASAFALAGQIFQPTLALYSAYSDSKEYIHILDLQVQLRVERIRYDTWGEYMGLKVEGSTKDQNANSEQRMHEWWKTHRSHLDLVIEILSLISQRLVDLEKFQQKYDRQYEVPAGQIDSIPENSNSGNTPTSAVARTEDEVANINSPSDLTALITARIAHHEKLTAERKSRSKRLSNLKFELFGKGKLEDLISDLRRYNDCLEDITGYQTPLRGRLFSRLLDSSSTEPLNQQLQELTELGSAASGVQPILAEMARRKAIFLRMKEQTNSTRTQNTTISRDPGPSLLYSALDNKGQGGCSGRDLGTYNGSRVMLEWKVLNTDSTGDPDGGLRRMRDLARFLSSHGVSSQPGGTSVNNSLHLLNCLGYLKEPGKSDTVALVYNIDASPCVTLSEMLKKKDRFGLPNFDLGTRLRLARQLAECVFYLHLTGWLHKGINSENVLIIGDRGLPGDTRNLNLFLAGFNTARLDAPGEPSEKFELNEETDLYHHPSYQGPNRQFSLYSRQYDIYSLGLVLLELGSWAPIRRLGQYDAQTNDPARFHSRLIRKYGPVHYLTSKTGNDYKKAVLWCLKDQFEITQPGLVASVSDEQRSQAFWEAVVIRLANIQVAE